MTRKACLIFNPVAGKSSQEEAEQDLENIKQLLSPQLELDIQLTSKEVGAGDLACEAVRRGVKTLIVSGGDGTLSAAAEALIEENVTLGVISRGTANAFANALGIPDTLEEACQTILDGHTKTVDTARCNGKPMVLLVGIGFEAETVEDTSRKAKNSIGVLAYLLAGLKQLPNFQPFKVEIETEDKIVRSMTAGAVTIANAAPPTSILAQGPEGIIYDDGLLEVTIVAVKNMVGAIGASYHLLQTALSGDAAKRDDIGYLRTRWLRVTAEPPQKVVLDGESFGTTPIEVECVPRGLTFFVPQKKAIALPEKLEGIQLEVEHK